MTSPLYAQSLQRCAVPGCGRPREHRENRPLSRYCRQHLDRYRRHGCAWLGSYKAEDLSPYRRACFEWIKAHPEQQGVKMGLAQIRGLMARGQREAIHLLTRQPAKAKASALWAQLAAFDVEPSIILAAILGVALRVEHDQMRGTVPSSSEYRNVQAAKLVLRLAGGAVRRWPSVTENGKPIELRSFVASEGRVLRVIGKQLFERVYALSESDRAELDTFAGAFLAKNAGRKLAPYPQSVRAKPKPRIPAELKAKPKATIPPLFRPDPDGGAPKTFVLNPDGTLSRVK